MPNHVNLVFLYCFLLCFFSLDHPGGSPDPQQSVSEPGSRRRVGAMAEEGKVRIEKFDGKDFGFWKMQIEDYLYQKKLHEPLSGKKPEKMEQVDWDLLDR